jgi:peroxiredoxin Q/BCP
MPVMLHVGDPAPDFAATDHRGNLVTLSGLKGRRFVLWFYPKADTPGCTRQGCGFRDQAAGYAEKGVAIFGVSFDTEAENAAFAEKFSFPFPLLSDTDHEVGLAYGACDSPTDGYAQRITYVIGPDGLIEQAMKTKDPGGQAASLLATL